MSDLWASLPGDQRWKTPTPSPALVSWIIRLIFCTTLVSLVLMPVVSPELPVSLIMVGVGPFLSVYFFAWFLIHRGAVRAAANAYLWLTFLLQLAVLIAAQDLQSQALLSFVNLVLSAGFMFGQRGALQMGLVCIVAFVSCQILHMLNMLPPSALVQSPGTTLVSIFCTLCGTCGLTYLGTRFTSDALERARTSQAESERSYAALERSAAADAERLVRAERLGQLARDVLDLRTAQEVSQHVADTLADVLPDIEVAIVDVAGHVTAVSHAAVVSPQSRMSWPIPRGEGHMERMLSADERRELSRVTQRPIDAARLIAGNQGPAFVVLVGAASAIERLETDWTVRVSWQVLSAGIRRIQIDHALAQSRRMESLGRLSAGIAQDFNNLLTSIMGGADLLSMRVKGDPKAEGYIASLCDSAGTVAALTEKLTAFASMASDGPMRLDLVPLLERMLPVLRGSVEERVEIDMILPDEEVWVRADPMELERALVNLVLNSQDAIVDHGRIEIGVETRSASLEGQQGVLAAVWVEDSGRGIPEELHDQVFEPFFSTWQSRGGAGLGLSIVYGVIQAIGGEVILASEPGEGTRIELMIPLTTAREASAQSTPRAEDGDQGTRILVVEDDVDVRETVVEMLRVGGYDVQAADNGHAALQMLQEDGSFSLVLSDVVMPQMGGFELYQEICALKAPPRVAFVSGYAPTSPPIDGDGAIPMITKPFTLKRLLGFVEDLLVPTP